MSSPKPVILAFTILCFTGAAIVLIIILRTAGHELANDFNNRHKKAVPQPTIQPPPQATVASAPETSPPP